nr:MOSC domain-containing protein [Rubellimicrobium sp.]
MPALVPTDFFATIIWLGRVAKPVGPDLIIHGEPVPEMPLTFAGYEGEVHAGLTRPSCSRVLALHPRNTTIANTRQLSLVSVEEMAEVAAAMGLEALDYAHVGASVVVEGIPDFTHVPPSSRLQGPDGTTLVVDLENGPCLQPAKTIEQVHPGHGRRFKPAAEERRGITAWIERQGTLRIGDSLRLHIPSQRPWAVPPGG